MRARTIASSRGSRSERPDLLSLSARSDHWTVLRGLLPFIWPKNRPDLRMQVAAAVVTLVVAKLVTIAVPVAFKHATDLLAEINPKLVATTADTLTLAVVALIVAYGLGRVLMMVLNQVRDVLFTRVGQNAVRELNNGRFAISTSCRCASISSAGPAGFRV